MKKITLLFGLLLSTLSFAQVVGDIFDVGDYKYEITSLSPNEVQVNGYQTTGGSPLPTAVNIPSSVTGGTGGLTYTVTAINTVAFQGPSVASPGSITSVTLPNSVTTIGEFSFRQNPITSITFGNSVTTIGQSAFRDLVGGGGGLGTGLVLPATVQTIGAGAFRTAGITGTLTIPASVTTIGNNTFAENAFTTLNMLGATPPTISYPGNSSFGNITGVDLEIPSGASAAYSGAPWSDFATLGAEALISSEEAIVSLSSDAIVVTSAVSLVTVYDIAGSVVLSSTDATVSISGIASGVYILKLDTDKGVVVKKFVK